MVFLEVPNGEDTRLFYNLWNSNGKDAEQSLVGLPSRSKCHSNASVSLWIYAIILLLITAYILLCHQTRWLVQNVTAFVVFVFQPHTKSVG